MLPRSAPHSYQLGARVSVTIGIRLKRTCGIVDGRFGFDAHKFYVRLREIEDLKAVKLQVILDEFDHAGLIIYHQDI